MALTPEKATASWRSWARARIGAALPELSDLSPEMLPTSVLPIIAQIGAKAAAAKVASSAASAAIGQSAVEPVVVAASGETRLAALTGLAQMATDSAIRQTSVNIAFVDGNIRDIATLVKNIAADRQVFILDTKTDGVAQIAAVLGRMKGVTSVQILSHGSEGNLYLGSGVLNRASMRTTHAAELKTIKAALASTADILIYGCDFAAGPDGNLAVQELAKRTGADVAASTDATGATALGGDWTLETTVGQIEAGNTLTATQMANWNNLLDVIPLGGGLGAFSFAVNNKIYSVNITTGKATLLYTDTALATNGLNGLAFDSTTGIFYYADNASSTFSKAIYAYNAKTGVRSVVTSDVTGFGVVLGASGLGSGGGSFSDGSYYFGLEGDSTTNNKDVLYKVNFNTGGLTISSIQLIDNTSIASSNEFGDLIVRADLGKVYVFNAGTSSGVTEYNLTLGASPSLTFVQTDTKAVVQAATDRNGTMYTVSTTFQSFDPTGSGTLGTAKTITTDGSTTIASAFDAANAVSAESSIAGRTWNDANSNRVRSAIPSFFLL